MLQVINNLPCGQSKPNFHVDHMMSSSFFLLCCFLTFSLHLLSQHRSYSQDVMPTRKLTMSVLAQDHKYHDTQVADEATESINAKEDSMAPEHTSNSYSPHDLVYHIDYHGVTTHPTPKHPKP